MRIWRESVDYDTMKCYSAQTFYDYMNKVRGWAPDDVADLTEAARLDWLSDLTDTLDIWREKANANMSSGELILGYANLGALIEGWLKLFYCVYVHQYQVDSNAPKRKAGLVIPPNDLKFEQLKQFSLEKLWAKGSPQAIWIEKVQLRRNAIHAFNTRDIGTSTEFSEDLEEYCSFVDEIHTRLGPAPGDF